jgi:hypothetical protein
MCTYYDNCDTSRLFGERKLITCYKVLKISKGLDSEGYQEPYTNKGDWLSPCYPIVYPKIGVVRSNRQDKDITSNEFYNKQICRGVHVYTSLDEAIKQAWVGDIIVPVLCHIDDFVGEDIKQSVAVFMKIRIHKRAQQFKYVVNPVKVKGKG